MKNVLVSCVVALSSMAFAEAAKPVDAKAAPKAEMKAEAAAPAAMPMWKPRMVTKAADKKAVEAMYKSSDEAMKKGDLEAMSAWVDFPVMMGTDNAAGMPSDSMFTKEMWMSTMKSSMENMPKDMKMTRKTNVHFLTDSLAWVEVDNTMTMGKEKMAWKSADYVVLKDGKWMVKMMVEGGWGDMMMPAKKDSAPVAAPAAAPMPAKNTAAAPTTK
ncbi:MAG: hypothetical protein JNG84_12875 [Archangium sp.]|nr:hypothetical protein [Archangium sp.]